MPTDETTADKSAETPTETELPANYRRLTVTRSITMPCLTCNISTRFEAHSLDKDDAVIVYRCELCGRRLVVDL